MAMAEADRGHPGEAARYLALAAEADPECRLLSRARRRLDPENDLPPEAPVD
jgi:hypothetical protein